MESKDLRKRKTIITEAIRENLFTLALQPSELDKPFAWHSDAHSPRSSQAFCLSAFGSLRNEQFSSVRNHIIAELVCAAFPWMRTRNQPRQWTINPEVERPELLNETGAGQPTSIDVVISSSKEVIVVESKFLVDALHGFGKCSQFQNGACHGFYGPCSDCKKRTSAWCRLESWDGQRAPRLYWAFGRTYFKPEIFNAQSPGQICVFRDSNFQLMRNFLFAAAYATTERKQSFGVLVACPKEHATKLVNQVERFRESLLPLYRDHIQLMDYERLIHLCSASKCLPATQLAEFLTQKISNVRSAIRSQPFHQHGS